MSFPGFICQHVQRQNELLLLYVQIVTRHKSRFLSAAEELQVHPQYTRRLIMGVDVSVLIACCLPSPPSVPKWGKVESSSLLSSAPLSKALLAAGPRHPRHEQSAWLGPSSSWGTCSGLAAGSWPEGLWSRAKVLGKTTQLGFSSL